MDIYLNKIDTRTGNNLLLLLARIGHMTNEWHSRIVTWIDGDVTIMVFLDLMVFVLLPLDGGRDMVRLRWSTNGNWLLGWHDVALGLPDGLAWKTYWFYTGNLFGRGTLTTSLPWCHSREPAMWIIRNGDVPGPNGVDVEFVSGRILATKWC